MKNYRKYHRRHGKMLQNLLKWDTSVLARLASEDRAFRRIGHNHENDVHANNCGHKCPVGRRRMVKNDKRKWACKYCLSQKFHWAGRAYESCFSHTDHATEELLPAFGLRAVCDECGLREHLLDEVDLIAHFAPIVLNTISGLSERRLE